MRIFADIYPGQREDEIFWNTWSGQKIGWELPAGCKRVWIDVHVDIDTLFPLRGEFLGHKTATEVHP